MSLARTAIGSASTVFSKPVRSAVISGGLGALSTASAKAMLRTDNYEKMYLMYPPFEAGKVDEVLETYEPQERERLRPVQCDMLQEEEVKQRFAEMEQDSNGTLSVLVNGAGYVKTCPFEKETVESFRQHMEINLTLPFIVSKTFCSTLLASQGPRSGRIIAIASQAGHVALENHSSYCTAKAGLLGMIRNIASELSARGNIQITTVSVSPTIVWTPLGMAAWSGPHGHAFKANIPAQRFCEPQEVGELVAYLAEAKSEMINGQDIRIDGGYTIR